MGENASNILENPEDYGLILLDSPELEYKSLNEIEIKSLPQKEYYFSSESITIPTDEPWTIDENMEYIRITTIVKEEELVSNAEFYRFIEIGDETDKQEFKSLVEEYMDPDEVSFNTLRAIGETYYYKEKVETGEKPEVFGRLVFIEQNGGLLIEFIMGMFR